MVTGQSLHLAECIIQFLKSLSNGFNLDIEFEFWAKIFENPPVLSSKNKEIGSDDELLAMCQIAEN